MLSASAGLFMPVPQIKRRADSSPVRPGRSERDTGMSAETIESLEQQLRSLYEDKEHLENRFGCSSPEDIANMVGCLEAQLQDFYGRFGEIDDTSDTGTVLLLSKIKELSGALDDQFSRKSVSFSFENGNPCLRAEWSEELTQGADK